MIAKYSERFILPKALTADRSFSSIFSKARLRDGSFRDQVISLHGAYCQVSEMKMLELIEAAHIVPVALDGVDHPANGIPLCPTHHSAFDRYLFAFDPVDHSVIFKTGLNSSILGITKTKLMAKVSTDALKMRLDLFREDSEI